MLAREEWSLPKVQPADVFSLESLIAWLEKQPADTGYSWYDCNGACLLDQYATSAGLDCEDHAVYGRLYLDFCTIASTKPATFGAALARARAVA